MHLSSADPVRPSHSVELADPAVLPLPVAPLRVPVLLPSPDIVPEAVPLPDALPDALPLPVALPLVEPLGEVAVLPLVDGDFVELSAASDAAEKASDTAAAIASI